MARTEVGTGTMLTSMISGGVAPNIVPDRCVLTVGRRIAPFEDPAVEYDRIAEIARRVSPLPIEVEPTLVSPDGSGPGSTAFYQSPDSDLVRTFAAAAGTVAKCAPFGTNALRYDSFAREKIVFGPGDIDDAHKARECVVIDDLVRLADVYRTWLQPT